MGFAKPNHLEYRNLMTAQGESLLQEEAQEEVTALITLQRLTDKINVFHREKSIDAHDPNHSITAEMNVQMFQSELDQWKLSTRDRVRNLRTHPICHQLMSAN